MSVATKYARENDRTVDLDDETVHLKRFPPLILNGHWLNDGEAFLVNSGETVKVLLSGDRIPSVINGGPLGNDQYEFYETHFHWGKENCRGAEHTINGIWSSMECHAVHWNRKYSTYENALDHKDGISVLVYLFLVRTGWCDYRDPGIERITENLRAVVEAGTETKIPANSLSWMRLATYCSSYYAYQGSYNGERYPKCATWIVFPLIVPIHQRQIEEFRSLTDKQGKFLNPKCRDIERLWGQRVFLAIPSEKYNKNHEQC